MSKNCKYKIWGETVQQIMGCSMVTILRKKLNLNNMLFHKRGDNPTSKSILEAAVLICPRAFASDALGSDLKSTCEISMMLMILRRKKNACGRLAKRPSMKGKQKRIRQRGKLPNVCPEGFYYKKHWHSKHILPQGSTSYDHIWLGYIVETQSTKHHSSQHPAQDFANTSQARNATMFACLKPSMRNTLNASSAI